MTDRQPVRESRRDDILAAAIRCFAARGFAATSTRAIAREAGVKQPLIFYHFGSKADLYLAAVRSQLDLLRAGLDAALDGVTDDFKRLQRFVYTYNEYVALHAPGLCVCLRELSGLPGDLPFQIARLHQEAATVLLQQIISDGIDSGTFRPIDPEACTFAIIGILHGFLRLRRSTRQRLGLDAPVRQVLDVYCAGLLSPRAKMRLCKRRAAQEIARN